jgi:hypothetical protein
LGSLIEPVDSFAASVIRGVLRLIRISGTDY